MIFFLFGLFPAKISLSKQNIGENQGEEKTTTTTTTTLMK